MEMNFRLAQEQIQNMKDSLTKELNEAKKNTTEARKAHIDAETQAVQLEQARSSHNSNLSVKLRFDAGGKLRLLVNRHWPH